MRVTIGPQKHKNSFILFDNCQIPYTSDFDYNLQSVVVRFFGLPPAQNPSSARVFFIFSHKQNERCSGISFVKKLSLRRIIKIVWCSGCCTYCMITAIKAGLDDQEVHF